MNGPVYQLNSDASMQGPMDGKGRLCRRAQGCDRRGGDLRPRRSPAAQLAAIKAGQAFAKVQLQVALSQAQQDDLQKYVDNLKDGEKPVLAMMQQFYLRYLDVKASLFAAIEDYRASSTSTGRSSNLPYIRRSSIRSTRSMSGWRT